MSSPQGAAENIQITIREHNLLLTKRHSLGGRGEGKIGGSVCLVWVFLKTQLWGCVYSNAANISGIDLFN